MEKILEKLQQKKNLTFDESKLAFKLLMTGKASEDEIYSFLTSPFSESRVKKL